MMACGEKTGIISLVSLETKFERQEFSEEIIEVIGFEIETGRLATYGGDKKVRVWKSGERIQFIADIEVDEIVKEIFVCRN